MTLPPLTYLTVDSLVEGVGASQVLPYVERLARRGLDITVHSFEHADASAEVERRLLSSGVTWRPHAFGPAGTRGGMLRVLRLSHAARGADLVHARSDLAAAAAMLGRATHWVWDVRSFWADQRIELGTLRAGSPEDRVLRRVERRAARSSDAIITLAAAAMPELEARHGPTIGAKVQVIRTCVDLDAFSLAPMPSDECVRLLFSGSLNRYYDVSTMLRLFERAQRRRPTEMTVLSPGATPWEDELARAGVRREMASPGTVAPHLRACHFGLSVCRSDVGASLRAAMPTKLGEFLATGRPVIVNRGLGDMDHLIAAHRCGVVLQADDDEALETGLADMDSLVADPQTADRCREVANTHFGLDAGVDRLIGTYEAITGRSGT